MCCQVLEHVANPMEIVENMKNVLKSKGILYIEVPNENFFRAYSDIEISEHINFFYKRTMEYIAKMMDLDLIAIKIDQCCRALFTKQ